MDWFVFALAAMFGFGVQSFLYKTSTERGYDSYFVMMIWMATTESLAAVYFLYIGNITYLWLTLGVASLHASFFLLKTFAQLRALRSLPTNVVFPITSSQVVFLVLIGVLFFDESLRLLQVIGIITIIISLLCINHQARKRGESAKQGLVFAFLAIIPGVLLEVVNKYAAAHFDAALFICIVYFFSLLFSGIGFASHPKSRFSASAFRLGVLIGVVNFTAYLSVLAAYRYGPLSLVNPILVCGLLVTIVLSKIVHNEGLSVQQLLFVLMSVAGIILLRW